MSRSTLLVALVVMLVALPLLAQDCNCPEEEKEKGPWESALGLSYVETSGNSETTSFGLDFHATRKPEPWGLEFTALFNQNSDSGVTTAERYFLGGRVSRKISDRWESFFGLSGEKDQFSGFDLRLIGSLGLTYNALLGPKHLLSFDGGLTYTDENRIDPEPDASWWGAVLGLDYEWKITGTTSLTERLMFYPNFDDSSDWRLWSDTGITTSINSHLALRFGYEYRYRNQPLVLLADGTVADTTDTTTRFSVVLNF
jgi:putative salt-induced outer membrane protein